RVQARPAPRAGRRRRRGARDRGLGLARGVPGMARQPCSSRDPGRARPAARGRSGAPRVRGGRGRRAVGGWGMTDGGGTTTLPSVVEQAVRGAVECRRDDLVELVRELVRRPSTLGSEAPAQELVEERLVAAGFEVERVVPDAEAALADPNAGYPFLPYEGRSSVAARLAGSGGGSSLHLSGHVAVVPVERPALWEHEPWSADVADGRIWGRGAGDMKAGLAAYRVAAAAVTETCDERRGDLVFSSVIEEECGGNGMWSVLRAGYDADATLIGESSGLRLGHAGTGVVWARLTAAG